MRPTIVIGGSLAQRPGHAGHAWVFLQYLLGFRRCGWEVLFLDELKPGMCVDEAGQPAPFAESWNLRFFLDVMRRHGLERAFSLDYHRGEQVVGVARSQVLERVRQSSLLLNVMGFLNDPDVLSIARRRVFLDIDPGFGQMWREMGLANVFAGHDAFVTIGQNVGSHECVVPTCGLNWVTTPQPIVLERWPISDPADGAGGAFTSVMSWRGPFGPIEYRGHTYGLRVHEFRKFMSLPGRARERFELAVDIHPDERRDLEALDAGGWARVDPRDVAGTPEAYQSYIARSKAEFMVAKGLYVDTRGGWFSDRSICYLACGRPVLAQDTGLEHLLPVGEGLLTFSTMDEAVAGVEAIATDYARHCRAARAIAEEHFDSDKVLPRLLSKLGVA